MSPTATGPEAEAVLIVAQEDGIDGADMGPVDPDVGEQFEHRPFAFVELGQG